MKQKLVLASASPRREELLRLLGLRFTIVPSKVQEEIYEKLPPEQMVQALARAKVEEVAQLVENTIIIGADTVVVAGKEILGKPKDKEEAVQMLTALQGKKHLVYTGLAVYSINREKILLDYDQTEVFLRGMSREEIEGYVNTGEPLDKAGAYGIQGLGGAFVERINGSFYTVMGLPIHKLVLMLREFGFKLF